MLFLSPLSLWQDTCPHSENGGEQRRAFCFWDFPWLCMSYCGAQRPCLAPSTCFRFTEKVLGAGPCPPPVFGRWLADKAAPTECFYFPPETLCCALKQSVVSWCRTSEEEEWEGCSDPGRDLCSHQGLPWIQVTGDCLPTSYGRCWPSSRVKFCLRASAALFRFGCWCSSFSDGI